MPSVPSCNRTLSLFEAFEAEGHPLPLSELAKHINAPVSSCHSLVRTLLDRGYLYSLGRRKTFYPTKRLFAAARAIVAHDPFLEHIGPALEALRDHTGETVIVGKLQGDAILYLEVIDSAQIVRYTAQPGEYKPLHSSAIGKALLGSLPLEQLQGWLAAHSLTRVTANTLTQPKRLAADLKESRRRSYFVTRGENVADVTAVAVTARVGGDLLGVAVAGPSHRMQPRERKIAAALIEACRLMEKEGDL